MANNHGHGAFGGILLGSRDIGPHTTDMGVTTAQDTGESHGLDPIGGFKQYLYGLCGNAASQNGRMVTDLAYAEAELAQMYDHTRGPEKLTIGFFRFDPGKWVVMLNTLRTSHAAPSSLGGVINTSANFQCTGVRRDGISLWSPHGDAAFEESEIQLITLTAVPDTMRIGVRAVGGTVIADVPDPTSNASWETAIESLPEYQSVTVTGTVTNTGGNLSGSKTATFDGADADTNVPTLQVVTGEVRTFHPASPAGNYKINNSGDFSAGTPVNAGGGNIQGLLRSTTGTGWSGVNASGTSSAGATNYATSGTIADSSGWGDPENAIDGDTGTATGGYPGGLIVIDLGQLRTIDRVVVAASMGGGGGFTGTVSLSDTGDFSGEEVTVGPLSLTSGPATFNFTSGDYRYVKLTGNSAGPSASIQEITVSNGAAAPVIDLVLRFAASAGNVAAGTAPTGTGAVAGYATPTEGGTLASGVTVGVPSDGSAASSTGGARWNLTSEETIGETVDAGGATTQGGRARLHVVVGAGATLPVLIKHSPDGNTWTTLVTFNPVTDMSEEDQRAQEIEIPVETTIERYRRVEVPDTIDGTFAFQVSLASVL